MENEKEQRWEMIVTYPDGSEWAYPVAAIALNRAQSYAFDYGGDVQRSLREDTLPLFMEDDYSIRDWAAGNMNHGDVGGRQVKPPGRPHMDLQDAWVNGPKRVVGKYQEPQQ